MFPRTGASGFKLCPMYTFLIFIISLVLIEIMSNDFLNYKKKYHQMHHMSIVNSIILAYLELISTFSTYLACCLLELSVATFSPTSRDPRGSDNGCQIPSRGSDNHCLVLYDF